MDSSHDPAPDHYRTLAGDSAGRIRVRRSRFLALAFPASSEEEFSARLARIGSEHFDATHHCWAFRPFASIPARSSDDGEPAGTAGRPILQAIESAGLHEVGIVVVRWFGGVRLGTGGLARAYRDAALAALAGAVPEERWLYVGFRVVTPHRDANLIHRMIRPPDVVLAGSEFGESARFELRVRRSLADEIARELAARGVEVSRID
ncbi:MAG TPA: YigZ family protein [Thermoanaerobaculia bacterium]|nr:YigZ family protein [Thermoanaerobaculia bacterium]